MTRSKNNGIRNSTKSKREIEKCHWKKQLSKMAQQIMKEEKKLKDDLFYEHELKTWEKEYEKNKHLYIDDHDEWISLYEYYDSIMKYKNTL